MREPAVIRFQNGLCTYLEARKFVDTVFIQMRSNAAAELSMEMDARRGEMSLANRNLGAGRDDELDIYIYAKIVMREIKLAWERAIEALTKTLLPKRARSASRLTVRTVNKGDRLTGQGRKAMPSMSQSARRARGEKRTSKKRSHVKRRYVPINAPGTVGRIRLTTAQKSERKKARDAVRNAARRDATAKARMERGWKPYHRAKGAIKGRWKSEVARRRVRANAMNEARAEMATLKRDRPDNRRNHHPEWGYKKPMKKGKLSAVGIVLQSAVLNARADRAREAGAKRYWKRAKKLRDEKMSEGARPIGRPIGRCDSRKRNRSGGGNAGSFGVRKNERSRALSEWLIERKKIAGRLKRWLAVVAWAQRRVAADRRSPARTASSLASLEYRKSQLEKVRQDLVNHWERRP